MTKWVHLGTNVMREARQQQGLSYETVARRAHVSSKTYERWEKRGEVPTQSLVDIARVLDLQIERAATKAVVQVTDQSDDDRLDRLEEQVGEVLKGVRALLAEHDGGEEPSVGGSA